MYVVAVTEQEKLIGTKIADHAIQRENRTVQ